MKIINSFANQTIKHVVKLKDSSYRKKYNECVVEGIRSLETFLQAQQELKSLYITEKWVNEELFKTSEDKIVIVSDSVMKKISSMTTPSGILAVFSIPETTLTLNKNDPPLILAQIQDPGNLGTLLRTAAAFNKKNIILVEGADPWSPKVIQASAGTVALVSLFQISWSEVLTLKKDFKFAALVPKNGQNPQNIDYSKTALIIGNEAHGLPEAWQESCDTKITLPMPGGTESLNAAITGSIMLYIAYTMTSNILKDQQ